MMKFSTPVSLLIFTPGAVAYLSMGGKRATSVEPRLSQDFPLVDVTGAHSYVAPDFNAGDLRGPCPGLNALANHNYLPHNGVGTFVDFVNAVSTVYGMSTNMAILLSAVGTDLDGDGTSWSIGGPPPTSLANSSDNLLGQPQGISGSHNKYECDSSPTRGDLFLVGNTYTLQMENFQSLYDMQKDAAQPNYNLEVLGDFRSQRWDDSVQTNPYFFSGPFAELIVSQAAHIFIYRFMANHSAEYPDGLLDKETLKSFFAVSGPDDALEWTPGTERIPDNWYRRAIGDEYTFPDFNLDFDSFMLRYPKLASLGGNTGTPNSFTGLNVANLTGGVFNAQDLLKGDNAMCLAFQALQQAQPDIINDAIVRNLTDVLEQATSALSCPQLQHIDESQFMMYPGASQLKSGGHY